MTKTLRNLCVLMTIMLWQMAAMAQTKYYVTLEAETQGSGSGSSWDNAMTLAKALEDAKAGDEIWMKGYEDTGNDKFYYVPGTAGYTVKSGVKLYGGFRGVDGETLDGREVIDGKAYRMKYRTVISGDISKNDTIDATNLIFPANGTRTDNATHVLTLKMEPGQNSGSEATEIDGITIAGGHAEGTDADGKGGGIFITGDNSRGGCYIVRRCFFIGNYATEGGALYVAADVTNANGTCLIDRCGFFNNAAGTRGEALNAGGAVSLDGAGTIVNTAIFNNENGGVKMAAGSINAAVVNTTVTRNTASGIDGQKCRVANTVIWGNSRLYTDGHEPSFNNCAYPEANPGGEPDGQGNIYLATRNNEEQGPHFDSPSLKTGFDTDYDVRSQQYPLWTWMPLEGSNLIDKGDNDQYEPNATIYGSTDLDGNPRTKGDKIDIGAFEFQPVTSIRYVKKDGTGDGRSWENASGDLQAMIDQLAESGEPGEVWVAEGEYEPLTQLITGTSYSASFRMRDGVSVYGGFVGGETSKTQRDERRKAVGGNAMPWQFFDDNGNQISTILSAAYYNAGNLEFTNNKWTTTSDSRHVVWFAPLGEGSFTHLTYLDGVTIRGGYAQGGVGLDEFKTDRGAGVYIDDRNAYLTNCTVTENYATGNGGGVYLKGGRVQTSLIYNNNADQGGGAVYVDESGLVHRAMLANNSARNGAGVYLDNTDGDNPEYLILSTCVVTNNTATGNGAIYCNRGGVLLQNTVANNQCVTSTDLTDPNASQTGGLYINEYALVANSVIWNNRMGASSVNIPMYAKNPTAAKVRFMYNAISGVNNAVWNNTLQEQTLALVDENRGEQDNSNSIGPRFIDTNDDISFNNFSPYNENATDQDKNYIDNAFGVQQDWRTIDYYWQPIDGSNLWARGLSLGQLPREVLVAPEIDIAGGLFAQKPAVGAFHVKKADIVPRLEMMQNKHYKLVLYVDVDCTEPENDGSSWSMAYRSLNDAISYFAALDDGVSFKYVASDGYPSVMKDYVFDIVDSFEIRVLEGDLWPRYAFVNEDPKTATLDILKMQSERPLKIVGGYYRNNGSNDDVQRDPLNHRSQLNGNSGGSTLADGLYHVVTVETGAQVELDGFHIINGYAASTASLHYGAGMLVHDNAQVTLTNCIFENNTAANGAALYASDNATVKMQNCVVNNNTNTLESNEIIAAKDLTLQHVTVVNNVGAAPAEMGTTSFSAGNTSGVNSSNIETTGKNNGAENFANPTNVVGATLGFDTYLGGYSSFRPLTSSAAAADDIINKVTATDADNPASDIMGNERDLGGAPDLGAYEADLPKKGSVLYVRTEGDDKNDGLSWGTAFASLSKALDVAENDNDKSVEEIWVAKGTYTHSSTDKIHTQYYGYKFVEGVNVYGGFSNYGAPNKDDRNPRTNETILQTTSEGPNNSLGQKSTGRVLVQKNGFSTETVYDGFTLQNGYLFSCYRQDIKGNIMAVKTEYIGQTGGAGVYLMANGIVENCEIRNNYVYVDPGTNSGMDQTKEPDKKVFEGGYHQAGAGVYNDGGIIRNCVIQGNKLIHKLALDNKGTVQSAWMYGAGLYMNSGTVFNTVICGNESRVENPKNYSGYYETLVGTGAFLVNGDFYNNTIVGNRSVSVKANAGDRSINITLSGVYVYTSMNMYNCIVSNNKDENGGGSSGDPLIIEGYPIVSFQNNASYTVAPENVTVRYSCVNIDKDSDKNLCRTNDPDGTNLYQDPNLGADYRLLSNSPAINTGTENIPDGDDGTIDIPDYDADYTNRIKDCAIDMGAYELDNKENIKCTIDGRNVGTYYVSQNGAGLRSGENPGNAACASKLQSILDDAGSKIENNELASAVVKLAGYKYEYDENGDLTFKYSPTALASKSDPQSYTFVVPDGVTVMGGFFEGKFNGGEYIEGSGWDEVTDEYKDNARNAFTFRTMLSAIAVPSSGSTITQEVNGYHAVTFGAGEGTTELTRGATIDGVWLVDGSATSMSGDGSPATMGGGAIVPAGAHVRNCVVTGNAAIQGGGLYVMPGGTVSGTAVLGNTAEDKGGGIYAASTDADDKTVTDDTRAHIISCTIADNEASTGGGLYLEDGASMQVNTVIWGNIAGTDKNVSGVTNRKFADSKLAGVFEINAGSNELYPFNNCFVESYEMPSDFENASLEGNEELYFVDNYRRPKDYSLLIKHGVRNEYQETTGSGTGFVDVFNVAETDIQGILRVQDDNAAERLDAGAFAYEGGILPTDLFTRIFVSQTKNVTLPDGTDMMMKYLGKSFYTSFSTLEDALEYIRSMRKDGQNQKVKFEVLVAGGTYKPTNMRDTKVDVTHDQRLYSFEVPAGVSIYGGFNGNEFISSKGENDTEYLTSIPGVEGNFECMGKIDEILSARDYSDFNQNNLYEPWELAEQTILSGQINVSSTEQNAYHVIYSEAKGGDVVLDGITVMDGKTAESLSTVQDENEQGRGGGIYSNGVNYTLRRCRVLNNTAVRGGGVFVRNADLNFTGCILAGNKTVANAASQQNNLTSRGGAAYIAEVSGGEVISLRAVNTLWANNESEGEGGAIGSNYGDGVYTDGDPYIDLMNNTFVKNKAKKNPVIYSHNAKSKVVNTLIWGNEGETYEGITDIANIYDVSHSASDVDYGGKFAEDSANGNIMLDQGNMDANGPRFTNPATTAGAEGNDANNLWNPVAISVVTDAGDGVSHTENRPEDEDENVHKPDDVTGAYNDWFDNGITEVYIKLASTDGTTEADNPMEYSRYSGPRSENNEELCKTIDIGVYEYQYYPEFSKMDKIYVDTISHGTGSGEGWANATDDLRGAIIGAANPTDKKAERFVYVRDGEYSWDRLSSGSAYILNMGDVNKNYSNSLTIKGSCTGVNDQQDFSKQTVVRAYEGKNPTQLMLVATNAKDVNIEGFTFINNTGGGTGINASTTIGGSLTLKNCAFRCNKGSGMNVSGNDGNMLVYNTLFADGGTGLTASSGLDNITLVNTTFANNKTADMSEGLSKVYNSASWNNGNQLMPEGNDNKVFGAGITNDANIQDCPNFVDPDNGDYHILPSLTLLNQGSNAHYAREVLGEENVTDETATIPGTEVDLGNSTRLVDDKIDIGAYEYEAPLQPIAYVKADVRNPDNLYDGKSWKTALPNLQGAANLVGIYAYNHKAENVKGYVFVHRNLQGQDVRLTLDNTNVYGGMNDEAVSEENKVYLEDGKINVDNVKSAVKDLLDKRAGLIENTSGNRSTLNNVTISAEGSVVDGFEVNGKASIDKGYLSTSIINDRATVNGDGILYNSLVYGNVSGIKAVNVTATGTISEGANNRASVDDNKTNTYVTDDAWKYQLMETSTKENGGDIDAGTDQKQTGDCINMVGHNRDIAGNKRIRNVVDNGCFETWDINTGDSTITENDYPHGKSVVYVREGRELSINERMPEYTESTPFNPGVLLLEHQAGLRGNGNSIGLSYVIMERNVPAGGVDMAYAPFQATMENVQGNPTRYYYDGAARAAYDYTFDANNGSAWTKTETETYNYNMGGLLLDNTADKGSAKVRFVGKGDNVYLERPNVSKFVTLDVNNFSDPWTANNHTGNKFTAKENMSWNLFGSPYLCAMNYDDMEYGRVIYGYRNNRYVTVKTYNDDGLGDVPDGYIPAGDAIFTQTAALSKSETFTVEQPVDGNKPTGTAYGGMEDLKVTITRTGETRAVEDGGTDGDVLQLNAVAPDKSRTDFDMGSDGVKWMADGVAQIYAVQGGGRYSLLSAVNIDGKVSVGVTLPEAGMYTIAVPDDCLADGYESVILEDAANGRKTNLLEGGYDFTSTTAGDIEGRFSISFNRMIDDRLDDGIRAYSIGGSVIRVEGVEPDDRIMVYSADGMSVASHVAASSVEDVRASVAAVAVVKVVRGGQTVAVRKIKVS